MFSVEKMLQLEMEFPESFSHTTVSDYGILYHNSQNPLSHDSNHAHIININGDTGRAIDDIVRFYRSREIIPRIYPSFMENELEILRPLLESRGFTTNYFPNVVFLFLTQEASFLELIGSVRRIKHISDDILELIHTDETGDWSINVIKQSVNDSRFHLLGLYYDEKCVSMDSVRIMDGYSRVDDVKTHMEYRGRHFGTRLMSYLAAYHSSISSNHLYLFAVNPFAIRLYKNIGFRDLQIDKPSWSAFLP